MIKFNFFFNPVNYLNKAFNIQNNSPLLKDILNKNSVSNASDTKANENISVIDSKEKKIPLKHINEEEMDDVIIESLNKAFQKPKPVLKESMDKGSFSKSNETILRINRHVLFEWS